MVGVHQLFYLLSALPDHPAVFIIGMPHLGTIPAPVVATFNLTGENAHATLPVRPRLPDSHLLLHRLEHGRLYDPFEKSLFVAFLSEFGAKKYCSTKTAATILNGNRKREQRSNRLSLWLPVFLLR